MTLPLMQHKNSVLIKLLPLYVVIFIGFVGYALMITIFTPMLLHSTHAIHTDLPIHQKTLLLGVILCVYPLGQFLGSAVLGALSDQFGRKRILLISLAITTFC